MRTYDLTKGTLVRLKDGRTAELRDSARRLTRHVVMEREPVSKLGTVCSCDIDAYLDADGVWRQDLVYSKEEIRLRERSGF